MIVLTGGGTGGHIFPLLALREEFEKRGIKTVYAGSIFGLEKEIVKEGIFLPVRGWVRKSIHERLLFLPGFLVSLFHAVLTAFDTRPEAIVSSGGFASVPFSLASLILGIPLYLLEPNSVPGLAVRFFSPFARKVFTGFETAGRFLRGKVVCSGIPVRRMEKMDRKRAREFFGIKKKYAVFVLGGSRGAKRLLELVRDTCKKVSECEFLAQVGDKSMPLPEEIKAYRFFERMDAVYSAADLIISRAGAGTVGELMLFDVPAILVPYPYAYLDHQYLNAKEAERYGGIRVVREEELTPEKRADLIREGLKGRFGKRRVRENPVLRVVEEICSG